MMRIERIFAVVGVTVGVLLCTGCAGFGRKGLEPQTKVTVRFVAPPDQFTLDHRATPVRLAAENNRSENREKDSFGFSEDPAFRVVLWGGEFQGQDVTYERTQLATGPYMFGLFDPDRGGAYQGWISVNNGGDDVLAALEDWRQSVQKQQEWLAYESRVSGQFEDRHAESFTDFEHNLKELRRLEDRISQAIQRERIECRRRGAKRSTMLAQAEVLIVPGRENFLRPWTRPTFSEEELSTVRAGTPLTKFVLVGDYVTASGKLQRIAELRDDLHRNQAVVSEEARRLEHRRRYYLLTDHIYNHGQKFVENERRLQEARGMIARLDRQIEDYNQKFEAILFVTGLFAPDDALAQFDANRDALIRERAVIETRVAQINVQINEVSERSDFRVRLERQRQRAHADLERLDDRVAQIDRAQRAVLELRDSTAVIHRHGPASVVTATMLDARVPPRFAHAVERESLLTVRLQAADATPRLDGQPGTVRTTAAAPIDWDQIFGGTD